MGGSKKKGKPEKAKAKPVAAKKAAKPPAVKSAAKPAKAPSKKPEAKAGTKADAKNVPVKLAAKTAAPAKTAAKPDAKGVKAAPAPIKADKGPKPVAPAKADVAKKGAAKTAVKTPEIPVDPNIKRPARPFFIEVKPGAERVIKRGDKSLAAPAPLDIQSRRKGTTADETPEELVERIERELEHQFFAKRNALKPQMCTKCGINAVTERFTIDRELGYCADCAEILRLGETKEARRMEFNPSVMKTDGAPKPAGETGGGEDEEAASSGEEPVPDIE